MQGGSKLPPSRTPLFFWDVGGAFGAALPVSCGVWRTRGLGLTRSGEALAYGDPLSFSSRIEEHPGAGAATILGCRPHERSPPTRRTRPAHRWSVAGHPGGPRLPVDPRG